jgi:transposase
MRNRRGHREKKFDATVPEVTRWPSYHPSVLLKLYSYGYPNHIQSSHRLERETKRNLEVIWLVQRLTPDDKTIAYANGRHSTADSQTGRPQGHACA